MNSERQKLSSSRRILSQGMSQVASMVATAGSYFALQRHEQLRSLTSRENSLRRQAEVALLLLTEKNRELAAALEKARVLSERLEAGEAAAADSLPAAPEANLDGVMVVDAQGEITDCNPRFAQMWGIAEELLAGGDSNALLLAVLGQVRDPAKFFERVTELYWLPEQESSDSVELTDGRCFERLSKPQLKEGTAVGRIWSFRDVTELKRLETQLVQAQKMEAIGTLAAGVAHNLNNIMTVIVGYTSLLMNDLSPVSPNRVYLEKIDESTGRAVALIQNLLSYSRKECVQTTAVECNVLVRNMAGLLKRLVGSEIDLVVSLSAKPQHVLADAQQIEQVLVNLSANARDAMPDGGRLTLEVGCVRLSNEFVKSFGASGGGPYVRITVSDTGSGMDQSTRERIFEPFFTTKELGEGTGLGLPVSYGIAKQHGGFISVDSGSGSGSSFSLHLPQAVAVSGQRTAMTGVAAPPAWR